METSEIRKLVMVSAMAPVTTPLYVSLASHLGRRLGVNVRFARVPWRRALAMLASGEAHAGFVCGLQYVLCVDKASVPFEPIVAPAMLGERYKGRAVYYSDVVVRVDSRYQRFDELEGKNWAFNEGTSHSGFNVIRYYLARTGRRDGFFGRAIRSASHQNSLRMVLNRKADAAAIDSTVLEATLRKYPRIANRLRVILSIGPSPAPPGVVSSTLGKEAKAALRSAFLSVHEAKGARALLERHGISRFLPVKDHYYRSIRAMARVAREVVLSREEVAGSAALQRDDGIRV